MQSIVFNTLGNSKYRFESFCAKKDSCSLDLALRREYFNFVYVSGTAYNFLNVFHKFSIANGNGHPLSESRIHSLEFVSETEASAAFSILNSKLVFWLWHTQADGFHVPDWFIRTLPFQKETFSVKQLSRLSELGKHLWTKVQAHRFSSINGGKLTYTFRPLSCNGERDEIDSILIEACSLPTQFKYELKRFVRNIVTVDENDHNRKHLTNYFTGGNDSCSEN